ncbi:MAG: hypothetical protein K0U38_12020 [Epsilonproteobacteria bacterium]|nr:hypothetical protein [Campylobacterota bacterium]
MKALTVLAILLAIGLIYLMYRKEADVKKALSSTLLLIGIISLAILGNVMRSIMPLFLAHIVALIFAYGGLLLYILRDKAYWYLWLLPLLTLATYVLLAWLGNEHIPNFRF